MVLTTKKTAATFALGVCGGTDYAITVADTVNNLFTVAGDHATEFASGYIGVLGSTDNDGVYTIVSATYNSGPDTTDIVVTQSLTSTTADGNLYFTKMPGSGDNVTVAHAISGAGNINFASINITADLVCGRIRSGAITGDFASNNAVVEVGGNIYIDGAISGSFCTMATIVATGYNITVIGAITTDFASYSTVDAANIKTSTIGGIFAVTSDVSTTGTIETGDITDNFNEDSTVTAVGITTGDIGNCFTFYSAATTLTTSTGDILIDGTIGGSFAYGASATVDATGYDIDITGAISSDFVYAGKVYAANITTLTMSEFAVSGSTVTATGLIDIGDTGLDFCSDSTVTAVGITTDDIGNMFCYYNASTASVTSTGDILIDGTLGGGATSAFVYGASASVDATGYDITITGAITGYFVHSGSVKAVDITTSTISYCFAGSYLADVNATGAIITDTITGDFNRNGTVDAASVETGNITGYFCVSDQYAGADIHVNTSGDITCGNITYCFAKNDNYTATYYVTVTARDIEIGSAIAFCSYATVTARNIATGALSDSFVTGTSANVHASGNITTGNIGGYCFNYAAIVDCEGDILVDGNVSGHFMTDTIQMDSRDITVTGTIYNCFAIAQSLTNFTVNARNIVTHEISYDFAQGCTINATDITTGLIGGYFANYMVYGGSTNYYSDINCSGDIETGVIYNSFNRGGTVDAVNITTGQVSSSFAEGVSGGMSPVIAYVTASGNIVAGAISLSFAKIGTIVAVNVTLSSLGSSGYIAEQGSTVDLSGNLLVYGGVGAITDNTSALDVDGYMVVNRNGIPNLAAGNIKSGVTILGITGNFYTGPLPVYLP